MTLAVHVDLQGEESLPEKRWVGPSFSHAASGYDRVAVLQRQVGEQLLERLLEKSFRPNTILDVGAGTGYCTSRLAELFPEAGLFALDIAEGMLRTLEQRPSLRGRVGSVCADAESLPLRDGSVDLVFSNLALQWCVDLPAVLAEFRRVLKPGGWMLFSTFSDGTLCELREAWAKADSYSHVNAFVPLVSVDSALARLAMDDVETKLERRVIGYPSVDALLRELKGLGAHNLTRNRPRHLTGKGVFRKMLAAYCASSPTGSIPASFELVQAVAYMPTADIGDRD